MRWLQVVGKGMKYPDPKKEAFDQEQSKREGYDPKAHQNLDAKIEVHGKNPPKDRNLPNLKR